MDDRTARHVPVRPLASGDSNAFADGASERVQRLLLSSSVVGTANRGLVIQALFDLGPTSRAELARRAGVNRTTISGIVQPLIDNDVLVETGPGQSKRSGGKPARPLWFSPSARPICGVLLMPDAVQACLVTLDGSIIGENRIALPKGDGPVGPIINAIKKSLRSALAAAERKPLGVGVAVGAMVDTDLGSIVAMKLAPSLDGYPLAEVLGREFDLPVRLDHHPRALLVGDRWFGKGRGAAQFAVIYTGEVLGGAFYFDGHLYRGVAGAGGELGHTFVQVGGLLCRCGRQGCWDTIATLGWLRSEAKAAQLPKPAEMNSGSLMRLVAAGDSRAAELADRYAHNIAVGIANVQQTLAPNLYILHGDVVLGGAPLIQAIANHVRRLVPSRPGLTIEISAGEPGDRAALLGAAGLVLSDLLQLSV
jgi:predicted NBD/HSP70 family sugar kinase